MLVHEPVLALRALSGTGAVQAVITTAGAGPLGLKCAFGTVALAVFLRLEGSMTLCAGVDVRALLTTFQVI